MTESVRAAVWRCVICDHEVDSTCRLRACPKCGTTSIPCDSSLDVTVKINWHELRILAIWAEFHANAAASAPRTIVGEIRDEEPAVQVFTQDDILEYFAAGNHPDVKIGPKEMDEK